MGSTRAAMGALIVALAACAPPAPTPPVADPPEITLSLDGARATAHVPAADPRWAPGATVDAISAQGEHVAALVVRAVVDGVATLDVLAQVPDRPLDGASLEVLEPRGSSTLSPRVRVRRGSTVELDQGSEAEIRLGDRYFALDGEGQITACLTVYAADPGRAFARIDVGAVVGRAHLRWVRVDFDALYVEPLRVVVDDPALAAALERQAPDALALEAIAPPAGAGADDATLDALGRRASAALAVGGPARCDARGCALPRLRAIAGPMVELIEPPCAPPRPGCWPMIRPVPAGEAPPVDAVADALLGDLAFVTRRFHLAEWHWRRALMRGAWGPAQAPWVHDRLLAAALEVRDWSRARQDLARMRAAAAAVDDRVALRWAEGFAVALLHLANRWDEAEAAGWDLVALAEAEGDVDLEAFAYRILGYVALDPAAAPARFAAAAERARWLGHDRAYADAMTGYVQRLHEAGRHAETRALIEGEILPLRAGPGQGQARAHALTFMAVALARTGEPDRALAILRDVVIPAHDRRGDLLDRATATGHVADILRERGELEEAARLLTDEVLPILGGPMSDRQRACWLEPLAVLEMKRGDWAAVARYAAEGAAIYARVGAELAHARFAMIEAVARSKGSYLVGVNLLTRAWARLDAVGLVDEVPLAQTLLADALMAGRDWHAAMSLLRGHVLPAYEAMGDHAQIGQTWGRIGRVTAGLGRLDEALRIYLEEEIPAYEAAADEDGWVDARAGLSEVWAARGDHDAAVRAVDEVMPWLDGLGPARSVGHRIALGRALVARGRPGDDDRARAELLAAREVAAAAGGPLVEQVDDVLWDHGWPPDVEPAGADGHDRAPPAGAAP